MVMRHDHENKQNPGKNLVMCHYPVHLPAAHRHCLLEPNPLVGPALFLNLTPAAKKNVIDVCPLPQPAVRADPTS